MALIQTTVSSTEPVTLAEIKTHLRIPSTSEGGSTNEDTLLSAYISVARKQCELITKRQIVRAGWQLIFRDFPSSTGAITLPRPPISSSAGDITITFIEDSTVGNTTTIPSTCYTVDYNSSPGRVFPINGNSWSNYSPRDQLNAITINYVSGNDTAIPEELKTWIKMRVGVLYEYREPITTDNYKELPFSFVDGLLDQYRVIDFGGLPD